MKNVAGLQLSKRDHFGAKLFMNLHLNLGVQVVLFQKHFFVSQLTQNMTCDLTEILHFCVQRIKALTHSA